MKIRGKKHCLKTFVDVCKRKTPNICNAFFSSCFKNLTHPHCLKITPKNLILQHCSQNANFFKDEKNREILFTFYFYFDDFFTNMSIFLSFPELVRTPCNYMSKFLALKFKMRLFFMISGIFQSFWMMQLSNYNSGFVKCISLFFFLKEFSSVLYLHEIQF